ncbi:formylglycine-generating enzyme family protein [Sorangium sp. So ce1000]|uniref:formylglycine-generating enzyme family protein n=1 Tax=Sorangium sp. So ce1000 TaxID=3133325 RepID=UPI003F6381B5
MCGPSGDESCCASAEAVPGGTFNRNNNTAHPATVSGFSLDRFEVTVGRFRKFVEAYPRSKPAEGAGAHSRIDGSGWDPDWDVNLPSDAGALKASVKCDLDFQTWTDAAGSNERLPMNCLDWYVAFAFCIWDGGRLPTDAEWNYAAAGGAEHRVYPWSEPPNSTILEPKHAVYDCIGDESASQVCTFEDVLAVGSRPDGDGRWRQADLSGSVWEWTLDWLDPIYPDMCDDCANVADPDASRRITRGGSFRFAASGLRTYFRGDFDPPGLDSSIGVRCARTP